MSNTPSFKGFSSPTTTPVPDALFDELLTELSGSELKVVLYIIRRTFGFKKTSDTISLKQMLHGITKKDGTPLDRGVGIRSKTTLLKVLNDLERKTLIVRQQRSNRERGSLPTAYRLKMVTGRLDSSEEGRGGPVFDPGGGSINNPGGGTAFTPPTRNRFTTNSFTNNVVKNRQKTIQEEPKAEAKDPAHVDYLVDEITKATGDTHSRGGFAKLAQITPDHKIFTALSEMKQAQGIRNRGAWFMSRVKSRKPQSDNKSQKRWNDP